jgi:hypothetical protein
LQSSGGVVQILKQKQYLRHAQYGLGVVSESNAERTTIDFEVHGVKKFVTELMQCELLSGEAPTRAALAKQNAKRRSAALSAKSKAALAKT